MTDIEFNEKYIQYLEKGHYGLDIGEPAVTEYLDTMFRDLTELPNFSYTQIKLKFNKARFYFKSSLPASIEVIIEFGIEKEINRIINAYKI